MIDVYIVAGFLGAGKTTLIQKLLKEGFKQDKVVLIKNDFGEISLDDALLESKRITVTEINAGCICCAPTSDFVSIFKEIAERFHPDKIIIEPSCFARISDITTTLKNPSIKDIFAVCKKITVIDVNRCKMYIDNFGDFFENQIKYADIILFSHTADHQNKVDAATQHLRNLNRHSTIIAAPWDQVSTDELLAPLPPDSEEDDQSENMQGPLFANHCPYCGNKGVLSYARSAEYPGGYFFCDPQKGGCSAQFCIITGKSHKNDNKGLTMVDEAKNTP